MSYWSRATDRAHVRALTPAKPRRLTAMGVAMALSLTLLATAAGAKPTYAATPTMGMAPTAAPVGAYVVVTGSDFPARARVQLRWDRSASGMPTAQASRRGTFKVTFRIPASSSGSHAVDAVERITGGIRGLGRFSPPTTLS